MILRYVPTYNLNTFRFTDLPYQVSHTGTYFACQYRFMVFSGPHEMVFQIKNRVRA